MNTNRSIKKYLFVFVTIVLSLLLYVGCNKGSRDVLYNGPEPPACVVNLEEDGESYGVYAAEGQLVVFFKETVSHREAVKILQGNEAKIVAQMPDVHCYLVEVPVGKESEFFSCFWTLPEVGYVFPNAIEELYSVTSHVIDNYYVDHGEKVVAMMGEDRVFVEKHNVGIKDDKWGRVSSYKTKEILKKTLDNLSKDESAVINMSFGPGLVRLEEIIGHWWEWQHNEVLWDDPFITVFEKNSYKESYINELVGLVNLIEAYDNKDFVIVKAIGNEGMKEMEKILGKLKTKLNDENKYAVFERHIILVSAKDDNGQIDYPNDISLGRYDKMVIKVDISDKTAEDLSWRGTSFSAPRAAGIIAMVADEYDKKVVDVLDYARTAVKNHPEHLLTMEGLIRQIPVYDSSKDNDERNISTNHDYVDLGLPSGTLWATCNLGASSPSDYGDYYSSIYAYVYFGEKIEDVASKTWGEDWEMPTFNDFLELKNNCTLQRTNNGCIVKGPNGNSIFLPVAGCREGSDRVLKYAGSRGYYWSISYKVIDRMICVGELSLRIDFDCDYYDGCDIGYSSYVLRESTIRPVIHR